MQNGKFPAGAAIAGAVSIAANTPIPIRADKDHRIAFSLLKGVDRCRKLQAERSAWLASIHVRASATQPQSRAAISPFNDCSTGQPRLRGHIPANARVYGLVGRWVVTAVHYARQTTVRSRVRPMKKSDIICPNCGAGYRRVELASGARTTGEFRCLLCDHVLEVFNGTTEVAIRLTVQPERTFQGISQ
jgi:hypothetical protein